jgi:hypothetical protein
LKTVLGCTDRVVALSVGRALESQRFFHDVNYENRLIDDITEIYQLNELFFHDPSVTSAVLSNYEDDSTTLLNPQLPTGVYTELTRCYSATCNYRRPCYSYTCPKRERLV